MIVELLKLFLIGAAVLTCLYIGGAQHLAVVAVVVLFVLAFAVIVGTEIHKKWRE